MSHNEPKVAAQSWMVTFFAAKIEVETGRQFCPRVSVVCDQEEVHQVVERVRAQGFAVCEVRESGHFWVVPYPPAAMLIERVPRGYKPDASEELWTDEPVTRH